MTEFYRAGFQLVKVRVWMLISLAAATGACWWGWDLLQTLGERPADGGVLQPFAIRFLVGGFVASLGLAFAFGMWCYSRLYVAALAHESVTGNLVIRTPRFVGWRTASFAPAEIAGTSFHRGDFANPVGVSVDAPWHGLDIKGRRFGYIIDARGRWLDTELASRMLTSPGTGNRVPGRRKTRLKRTAESDGDAASSGR